MAKKVSKIAEGGSDDDDAATDAYEAAQKKVRVATTEKDDGEIALTLSVLFSLNFCCCDHKVHVSR